MKVNRLWMRVLCLAASLLCVFLAGLSAEPMLTVNSLADLKGLAPQAVPGLKLSAMVKYRTQVNDNGGGVFTWDSSLNEPTDEAIVVAPNNYTGVGRWKRNYEGVIQPSWFGALGNGNDDHDALQAVFDRPEPVRFDRSYATVLPVEVRTAGKVVDFGGYSLAGISTTPQDAVLWITGRDLTLIDVTISCNFNPYNTAVHWMSTAENPSQNNRVIGFTVYNAAVGLLFGSYPYVTNPPAVAQTGNHIYGVMFRGVNNCIQMNQPGGSLAIDGGNIDCGAYEWGGNFDAAGSRCYKVAGGELRITNCEMLKTQTQAGYGFEGPAVITNCTAEVQSNWFLNPGDATINGMGGYMGNDSASYFTVPTGATGHCVVNNFGVTRGTGCIAYSGQPLINAPNAPDYRFTISNSSFTEWRQSYLTNGNAKISIENSRFPTDTGSQAECERRFQTAITMKTGFGSPEGAVRATVGSMYLRGDGGTNTCFYMKQSGTNAYGWVPLTQWTPAAQELSIADAKLADDNTLVLCTGYVSAIYSDCFYIEEGGRSSGIRVQKSGYTPVLHKEIAAMGLVSTLASSERFINASTIMATGLPDKFIAPVGMKITSLLGSGAAGGTGLNNTGLLVAVWGRVTALGGSLYSLSDGSGAQARVEMRSGSINNGAYVLVTGALSCVKDGTVTVPLVIVNGVSNVTYCD